jgi:hypothetical protein
MKPRSDIYGVRIDITGNRYGHLVVIGRDFSTRKNYWICKCDCGNTKSIFRGHITSGKITDCGCRRKEKVKKIHGESNTRLFHIWIGMHTRCNNPHCKCYPDYGGRGVSICDEWENYITFRNWSLAHRYNDILTIDRIDNNGNYCPENCRWVDAKTQSNNRRSNHYLSFNGERHTIREWEIIKLFPKGLIEGRLRCGGTIEKILTTPVKGKNPTGRDA